MKAAQAAGTLDPALTRAYFTSPRPVYELYDLQADPSELMNLSGTPALARIEHDLRLALAEKMILDFDYLPLPALVHASGNNRPTSSTGGRRNGKRPPEPN